MKIETFNPTNLAQLRKDFDVALQPLCDKYGISIKLGNIRYARHLASGKVDFATESITPIKSESPSDYVGRRFKHGKRIFTISIRNGRLIGTTERDKDYYLTVDQICGMIEIK